MSAIQLGVGRLFLIRDTEQIVFAVDLKVLTIGLLDNSVSLRRDRAVSRLTVGIGIGVVYRSLGILFTHDGLLVADDVL